MLPHALRARRRFVLLLLLFIAGVLAQRAVLPPMEGGDEYLQYNYVQFLAAENRLPDRSAYAENSTRQQSGQPPLVYWTASLLMRVFNLPLVDGVQLLDRYERLKNPWYAPPDPWNRSDNRNLHFQGAGEQSFATPDMERVDQIIRFSALGFGLLAVVGAYATAREVFAQESWALTAAAIFALTPQMLHLSGFVNTDVGSAAFTTLAVWQALRLLRCGASPKRVLWTSVLLSLAVLAKINALLALPAIGAALLMDARRRRLSGRQLAINLLLFALPLALIVGPWTAYGLLTFQDPLGTRTHLRSGYYFEEPLNLLQIIPLLPEVYLSYWGKLGSAVYLHPVTYTALAVILVLAAGGLGAAIFRRRRTDAFAPALSVFPLHYRFEGENGLRVGQGCILLILFVCCFVGLVHWLQTVQFITGRLIYPAHIAVVIGVAEGLRLLALHWRRFGRAARLYAAAAIAGSGIIAGPVSLYTAYVPPSLLARDQLPPLQGSPVDYDGVIRFLGYRQQGNVLTGALHTVELCWQILQSTQRPAAFSLKFVRDGVIVGDRTSVHGMGRYFSPLWRPGDHFCDQVDVPVMLPLQTGQAYDMLLVLLDARTQAVDWQAATPDGTNIEFPFIGQVIGG